MRHLFENVGPWIVSGGFLTGYKYDMFVSQWVIVAALTISVSMFAYFVIRNIIEYREESQHNEH